MSQRYVKKVVTKFYTALKNKHFGNPVKIETNIITASNLLIMTRFTLRQTKLTDIVTKCQTQHITSVIKCVVSDVILLLYWSIDTQRHVEYKIRHS
jgi:hypothetical protein